jgi:hypothetical protein
VREDRAAISSYKAQPAERAYDEKEGKEEKKLLERREKHNREMRENTILGLGLWVLGWFRTWDLECI